MTRTMCIQPLNSPVSSTRFAFGTSVISINASTDYRVSVSAYPDTLYDPVYLEITCTTRSTWRSPCRTTTRQRCSASVVWSWSVSVATCLVSIRARSTTPSPTTPCTLSSLSLSLSPSVFVCVCACVCVCVCFGAFTPDAVPCGAVRCLALRCVAFSCERGYMLRLVASFFCRTVPRGAGYDVNAASVTDYLTYYSKDVRFLEQKRGQWRYLLPV